MKYFGVSFLIFLAMLSLSCASRPVTVPVDTASASLPLETDLSEEEPEEPFERALWNIKMNTSLFTKYFEGGTAIVSGPGIRGAESIMVRGDAQIDEREFRVSYNLVNAVQTDTNQFRIGFFLEDLTCGISRFDELYWSPDRDEAGVLLSFDDDHWHTWRRHFDLFDRYDAKVTFFVQGNLAPGRLDSEILDFCNEAISRGHDLGFHTINHYDLRNVSSDTFDAETIEAAGAFIDTGISFSAFAFPFGFSQPWMREVLAPVFPVTRGYGANIRFYDTESISNGYIISKAIDTIMYWDDNRFESHIHLILLAAKFTGNTIVPLTTHDISDTAQWGIKPGRLEFLLRTAQDLQMSFYTYRQIIP